MSERISDAEKGYRACGELFAEMRKARGITQGAVAENLTTQRAISNMEQRGEIPSPLVFDVLMRRLGASMQFFMTMLTQREYEYLCWKEKILKKIGDGSIRYEDLNCGMAQSRQIHEVLQGQFAEFWQGYLLGDIKLMDQAIAKTVTGYPRPISMSKCLSSEEIMYMLLSLEKRLSDYPMQWQSVKELFLSILQYIETNYLEEEQLKSVWQSCLPVRSIRAGC